MTTESAARSVHNTAAAATEDVITITGSYRSLLVTNRGSNPLYFRLDNVAAVAAANETIFVGPGTAKKVRDSNGPAGNRVVRLISTLGTDYSVEAF